MIKLGTWADGASAHLMPLKGCPATSRRWYLLSTQAPGRSPKKKQNGEVGLWKQVSR